MSDRNLAVWQRHQSFDRRRRDLTSPNLLQNSAPIRRNAFLVLNCRSNTFGRFIDHFKTLPFLSFKRSSHLRVVAHSFCKVYSHLRIHLSCRRMRQFLRLFLRVLVVALIVFRWLSLLSLTFFHWK